MHMKYLCQHSLSCVSAPSPPNNPIKLMDSPIRANEGVVVDIAVVSDLDDAALGVEVVRVRWGKQREPFVAAACVGM